MSLSYCIPDLIAQGKIDPARAKRVQDRYEFILRDLEAKGHPRETAQALATDRALKLIEKDNAVQRRDTLRQAKVQLERAKGYRMAAGDGPISAKAMQDRMVALDKKMDVVRNRLLQGFDKFLADHRRDVFGRLRNASDLDNVGRELFGEKTGDLNAEELAKAMAETMDIARQRRNAAGGHIGKLDTYGLPQRHDWRAVRAVPYEEWRNFEPIANARVLDTETGEFATGPQREAILRAVYETIRTDGGSKAKPGQMFSGAMKNRRSDPRVLHFSGWDEWSAYQKRFGAGETLYDTFLGHISAMSREIAMMEEMGPNPAATLRFEQDLLDQDTKIRGTPKQIDKLVGEKAQLKRLYDELTGENKIPESRSIALGFSAFRAQQVAAKLGSAILSTPADMATLMKTSDFNGIPVMKTLARYTSLWNPANAEERLLASRLGLITDDWLALSSSSHRYTGEELTGEVSRRLADFVIRSQGLARHTRNAQWAFGMEFLSHLTQMRNRSFDQIEPATRAAMIRHGVDAADWDKYRATATKTERGTDWIFPTEVADRAVGDKMLQMILEETDYAVIMPDLRTRELMSRMRPGTWSGEIMRSAFLFKSFPLAIYNLHWRRMMDQAGGWNRAKYGLTLFAMMMAGGALASQLKMLATGKDPQPMNDAKFWGKAAVQSGGLGLFGDLIYNSENSFGGGFVKTLAGPVLGQTVPNAVDATFGAGMRALDGDPDTEAKFGKGMTNTLLGEVPGSNLWYTRLAYQRLFADMVREWTDPDAAGAFDRMNDKAAKEGTSYWLAPGSYGDDMRMPDFSNTWPEASEDVE